MIFKAQITRINKLHDNLHRFDEWEQNFIKSMKSIVDRVQAVQIRTLTRKQTDILFRLEEKL